MLIDWPVMTKAELIFTSKKFIFNIDNDNRLKIM